MSGSAEKGVPADATPGAQAGVPAEDVPSRAVRLVHALADRGLSVAVAESLTGGLVVESLVEVPGASAVVRGGVVAYATDVKHSVLGVPAGLLAERGAVDPDVAREMAGGVRAVLDADVGLATTGAAGPQGQDGAPPGRVHVAVVVAGVERVRSVQLDGDRRAVRTGARDLVLDLALEVLGEGVGNC